MKKNAELINKEVKELQQKVEALAKIDSLTNPDYGGKLQEICSTLKEIRNLHIFNLVKGGKDQDVVAEQFGLPPARVHQIITEQIKTIKCGEVLLTRQEFADRWEQFSDNIENSLAKSRSTDSK